MLKVSSQHEPGRSTFALTMRCVGEEREGRAVEYWGASLPYGAPTSVWRTYGRRWLRVQLTMIVFNVLS